MPTALIVDDHPEALYLLRCLLEAEGFRVVEAPNGREALEQAAAQTFDLIVSDILMPVMDGFSLCRTWKSDPRLRDTPFVIYTATYVDKRDEDLALSLGADLFLIKPTEPAVFIERIREALARHRDGSLPTPQGEVHEAPFLQQYNEVLIRKLEDKLQQLEEANQALRLKDLALSSSRNGVLLADRDGKVTYANPAMLRLLGRRTEDVLGKPARGLFGQPSTFTAWFGQDEHAPPLELDLATRTAARASTWLRMEKHAVSDAAGAPLGTMLSCADVTQERHVRHELGRMQRLDALSLFAAGVAHDFNNLLTAIFSVLERDGHEGVDTEQHRENRAVARAALERARDLTRRLATFAQHKPSERRPVDLRQLLDESIALCLSGSNIRCQKRYAGVPAVAYVDAGQIAQVFINLLVNARQAMNDEGELSVVVTVAASAAPGKESMGGSIIIGITDDGPGISPDVLPNIFEPYFTTKPEGTGLGLATSRAILDEHGGRISVRRERSAVTTFEVTLPSYRGDTSAASAEPGPPAGGHQGRVLVMDDEVTIRALLRRGLERAGYAVVVAGHGEQALSEFKRAKAEGRPFDLVLLDITIAGGMGGNETLAELLRVEPSVLAIATTGASDIEVDERLHHEGFARVIGKPFLLHELYAIIKAVLSPRTPGPTLNEH